MTKSLYEKSGTAKVKVFSTAVMGAIALIVSMPALANHPPGPPDKVTICHKPGTPAQKTLTLPHRAAEKHIARHGDTLGPCLNEFLPFLQKSNVVQVDTGKLLEAIQAGEEVELPCAAPGGQFAMIQSFLTERDLRAPGSDLPFLNTYEIPMEEVEARGMAGVFSITEEDFRSWVTDPSLGMCFAEPIGPLLRLNNVPESQVEAILAFGNTVVYNVTDTLPGPVDRSKVDFPPEDDDDLISRKAGPLDHSTTDGRRNNLAVPDARVYSMVYPLRGLRYTDGILPRARFVKVKHRTADGGDTADFGALFMGYVADINFQNAVGTAYGVTGGARDTKVRELLGWWNQLFYDTLHWYEPATARGGHNRYNIIPVIGSIDLCGVAASDDYARNCPHTVQHVNVGVSMRGTAGGGRGNFDGLACGHAGSVVNGVALTCTNDRNHAGIFYGSGQTDAMMFSVLGEEVGHVFGCEPRGAPGTNADGVPGNDDDFHTFAAVTFDGIMGPSFMTGQWVPTFRPLYTDACDQVIRDRVNSNIPPPTTGAH